ncbi:MAG: cation-efflux pump [Nitrosospira sp. 56-18]|jgi:cation diffusion facilitator family transporter|nr:cation transporter [Nitrosospira sp.]OJY12137.1 MAG: cation-efflux pump [Nitrosospira sp. 56-18]
MRLPDSLRRYAWLSVSTALATILLKSVAWWLTGSVGLLSDALESLVNLAGALMALAMLTLSAIPPDANHPYGHGKAEYFSSGFEGFLVVLAAIGICYAAVIRLFNPRMLEDVGAGLIVSVIASMLNLATARILLRVGRTHHSISLEADAHHLLSDVWTSAGVILGVGSVLLTGWLWLDPVIAILVAVNILRIGWQLMRRSVDGLMDAALPPETLHVIKGVLDSYHAEGVDFHALRTRQAGKQAFATVNILVPGDWTVQKGHDYLSRIESNLQAAVPYLHVTTHMEPRNEARDGKINRCQEEVF